MKNLFTLFLFMSISLSSVLAQGKVDYDTRSRFYLGFNVGATYHTRTEVDFNSMYRGAGGFTFGYSFGMKPNRLISADLQLRYLLGSFKGAAQTEYLFGSPTSLDVLGDGTTLPQINDYNSAYGRYAPNFHTWVNDWSLELKLNTNRLRENTGWNFFVLGGIGYNRYTTRVDFYQPNSTQIKPELDLINTVEFNSDYESKVVENIDWMPSFGLGIEKQITPNSALSFLHRTTWTRHNDFDALNNTFNTGTPSDLNDRYHIITGGFKFYLRGSKNRPIQDEVVEPPKPPITGQKPAVTINNPKNSPHTVSVNTYSLTAAVHFVAGANNITFTQNGSVLGGFSYDANTDAFQSKVNLIEGKNTFVIIGKNEFGKAQDQTVIIYQKPVTTPPVVTFTNPTVNPKIVNASTFPITAEVLHVSAKNNISVRVNGQSLNNFSFSPGINQVSFNANLIQGANTISIEGTNSFGRDAANTTIIYNQIQTVQPPIVTIVTPNNNPSTTNNSSIGVTGKVLYVNSKINIKVKINGQFTNTFNYNQSSKLVTFTANLNQGSNTIQIIGTNVDGQDQASTVVIYNRALNPPKVTISSPSTDNKVYTSPNINLSATVLNVTNANNISVVVNGIVTTNFSFNVSSKALNLPLTLVNGSNTVQITGTNSDGSDSKTRLIKYKKAVALNPPTVVFTNPNVTPASTSSSTFNVLATTTNISANSQIVFTQNGTVINSSSYNFANNTVSYQANLVAGANLFQITVTNSAGTDTKNTVIEYNQINNPCTAPTVGYVAPVPNSTVTAANHDIEAQINNYIAGTSVELTLNGVLQGAMTFNTTTQIAKRNVTLNPGTNSLEIKVSNNCGTNRSTFILIYNAPTPPCVSPVVIMNSQGGNVTSAQFNFSGNVSNVTNSNTISLKLNGVTKAFNFNSNSGLVTAVLTLAQGNNAIELTATNACGIDAKTIQVNANTCVTPKLSIIPPNGLLQTTALSNYNITVGSVGVLTQQDITVTFNGNTIPFNYNSSTQQIQVSISNLIVGLNTIIVKIDNACGKDELRYEITRTQCLKPVIQVKSSTANTTSTNYTYSAIVTNMLTNNGIVLTLNGVNVPFNFNAQTGQLTANIVLKGGTNIIVLTATNSCGTVNNSISITSNPCVNPQITTVNPLKLTQSTTGTSFNFEALTVGISNQNQISVKLNNNAIGFNFSTTSKKVSGNVSGLKLGLNTIEVKVINPCGSKTLTYSVTRSQCVKPVVKISSANTNVTTTSYLLSATVSNVASKTDIILKLNGKSVPFNFNVQTKVLVANLTLKSGSNSIVLTGNNSCGSSNVSLTVKATLCSKPTLNPVSPSKLIVSTNQSTYNIQAISKGIKAKSELRVRLNGSNVPFSFSASTRKITVNITNLKMGLSTLIIEGVNPCGRSVLTYKITRTQCVKPVVKINNTNLQVTTLAYAFNATVTGATSVKSIKLNVNGVAKAFNYNAQNGVVTASLTLKEGANVILLTGTNTCGNTSKSINVTATTCTTPVVQAGYPTNLNVTTSNAVFVVSAKVFNVTNSNQITVTNNGNAIPFTFNASLNQVTISVTNMTSGKNNIKIKAANACGSADITYIIDYQGTGGNRTNQGGGNSGQNNSKQKRQ